MITRSLLVAAITFIGLAMPASATPQCFIEWRGVITDLSHLCGSNGVSSTVTIPTRQLPERPTRTSGANVVALSFTNRQWNQNYTELSETATLSGAISNIGNAAAENVVLTITGHADGRNPEVKTVRVGRVGTEQIEQIEAIEFDFGIPLESWDIDVTWD